MKKARLKINYYCDNEPTCYKQGDIIEFSDKHNMYCYLRYMNKSGLSKEFVESNPDIFEVFEEKSAEELANELGFKISDKCYYKLCYFGEILSFDIDAGNVYANFKNKQDCAYLRNITNKVAIYCPTKEDFEFTIKQLNRSKGLIYDNDYKYFPINSSLMLNENNIDDYLILSIDEYCKSQGIEPLFVTEDKINIWYKKELWVIDDNSIRKVDLHYATIPYLQEYKVFSTEQAAKDYLESIKPKFEVDKWYSSKIYGYMCYMYYNKHNNLDGYPGYIDAIWNDHLIYIKGLKDFNWKPADIDKVKELLLNECKKRFPIGTKVRCLCDDREYIIKTHSYDPLIERNKMKFWGTDIRRNIVLLYKEGKFAEIISPSCIKWLADKFQVLKLEPYLDEKPTSLKGKFFDTEKEAIEYHKSLQPKNVVEVEIPKGYKYSHQTFAIVHDGSRPITDDSIVVKSTYFKKQSIKSCKTCLFELHNLGQTANRPCDACNNFLKSNKTSYWQSKQDLSNTKIFIGDNHKLSELVQKKAFELGWEGYYTNQIKFDRNNLWLFFDNNKMISWEFTNKPSNLYIEITPQDLGIKEKDYKVILTTEDSLNIYYKCHPDIYYVNINTLTSGIDKANTLYSPNKINFKYFSTKQAAEKYIFGKKLEELKQQYNQ
jgi:hypothetical protein